MKVWHGIEGLKQLPAGAVLSVGNFDGIHLGHRKLIQMARELRQRDGGEIAIVTFEPHPLTVLRPEAAPPRLTPAAQKQALLDELGVDHLVVLAPTNEVLGLTAQAFWALLRDQVRPRHMIEGGTFNFGKGRGGNIERLTEWTAASSVKLHVLESVGVVLLDLSIVDVNSSLIRWLIANGRMRDAAICLGRTYSLHGEVVKGFERGRKIGVPTANLKVDEQMVPLDGVYAGRCEVRSVNHAAAISIGTMPTFKENVRQVEAHLIDFDGDLYGQMLRVEVTDWIREQRKFSGIDALVAQMKLDIGRARALSGLDASRAIAQVG
jgi:riboflavin kinase/FMN adenylyltransferase